MVHEQAFRLVNMPLLVIWPLSNIIGTSTINLVLMEMRDVFIFIATKQNICVRLNELWGRWKSEIRDLTRIDLTVFESVPD